jgi:hypothetical protein
LEKRFQFGVPEDPTPRGPAKALAVVVGCGLIFVVLVLGVLLLRG